MLRNHVCVATVGVAAAVVFAVFVSAVTIDELGFTEERCHAIRTQVGFGFIPCECRLNTGLVKANKCYPNCCPKTAKFEGDRCHMQNKLEWNVYEQLVCGERPSKEYVDDVANCYYRGNTPQVVSVVAAGGVTHIEFDLSLRRDHRCHNMYVSNCQLERAGRDGFFVNTSDPVPKRCWQTCPPIPLEPCSEASCVYHRGETPPVVQSWTLPVQLTPNDYTLVCETFMKGDAVGTNIFQFAYAIVGFKVT